MNKDRRKRLEKIRHAINLLAVDVENIRDEEQEAFDNLPESIQGSTMGEDMVCNVDALDSAVELLQNIIQEIDNATEE